MEANKGPTLQKDDKMNTINPLTTARTQFFEDNNVSVESNLFELAVEAVRNGNGGATLVFCGPAGSYHMTAHKVVVDIVEGRRKNLSLAANVSPAAVKFVAEAGHRMAVDPTMERASAIVFYSSEEHIGIAVLSND